MGAYRLGASCEGLAEGVGFEPTDACTSPVFKTGALDHSATLPEKKNYTGSFRLCASLYGKRPTEVCETCLIPTTDGVELLTAGHG